MDGEDPGVPDAVVDAHVATCEACASWAVQVGALSARLGDGPASPDLDPAVLATLMRGAAEPKVQMLSLNEWRVILGVVGVLQLVTSWPGLVLSGGHASEHLAHELTTWDIGLALCFILLAVMPSRAWGALPVVAVLVVAMVGMSAADLVTGHALLGREAVHLLEVAGLSSLWVLARRMPRSSVVVRLA